MLCKCGLCRHVVSACTLVDSVETNKHIVKFFSPSGSHAILRFPYQMSWQYSNVNPSNGDVECRCGRHKSRFWTNSWLSIDDCCSARSTIDDRLDAVVYHSYGAPLFTAQRRPHIIEYGEENRTEQNLYAAVNLKRK